MRSVQSLRVSLAAVFVAGLALVVVGASHPRTASAAPEEMTTALESAGFHLAPPQASRAAVADSELNSAIDVARAQFGPAGEATAIPGTLTVDNDRVGGEKAPLTVVDRPVIAVQITGLDLPPMGSHGSEADPKRNHHELVVFVDATTGEYLMATTVR
jgi:hypothetical protein